MPRRPALKLLISASLLAGLVLGLASSADARLLPLLPLSRGQLLASLGTPPQWLPVSGSPVTLTLFSGPPAVPDPARANAYVALQDAGRRCADSASSDGVHPIHEISRFYRSGDQLAGSGSPFAPAGGAAAGDYSAGLGGLVVRQRGASRICVWLGASPGQRGLAAQQVVPMLNGLFAASVWTLPAARGISPSYTMDAIDVARGFRFDVTGVDCGASYDDGAQTVTDGSLATETIAAGGGCPDGSTTFTFSGLGGERLGSLTYSDANLAASPPAIVGLGGCELGSLTGASLRVAAGYVTAVGCRVGRELVQPFEPGIPRGSVAEAQVEGGVADVAPSGTAVDLVLNGRG